MMKRKEQPMPDVPLRECPFCDGERVYTKKVTGGVLTFNCPDCGLMATFSGPDAGLALKAGKMGEFAVKKWNERKRDHIQAE